jgi:organic radical activating enzyme
LNNLNDQLLFEGKVLPVMEEFHSLQGEGYNTGKAAFFLRIGGCDVGCRWCDVKESWNASAFPPKPVSEVIRHALSYKARSVVITGGEPLLYNLNHLCDEFKANHFETFLETSGSQPLSGTWDWICLSPKRDAPPLKEMLKLANELKVIIQDETDFTWAEESLEGVSDHCLLYLQPEWSRRNTMMPSIVRYIEENPKWRISLQSHKYMRIP